MNENFGYSCRTPVGKSQKKIPVLRPSCRWEDNTKLFREKCSIKIWAELK